MFATCARLDTHDGYFDIWILEHVAGRRQLALQRHRSQIFRLAITWRWGAGRWGVGEGCEGVSQKVRPTPFAWDQGGVRIRPPVAAETTLPISRPMVPVLSRTTSPTCAQRAAN